MTLLLKASVWGPTLSYARDTQSQVKGNEGPKDRDSPQELDPGGSSNAEALTFRSLFFRAVRDSVSQRRFAHMVLYPAKDLFTAPQTSFQAIDRHYQKILPEKLLLKSLKTPPKPVDLPQLKTQKNPPTLVVIPGAFSEFAYGTIFSEAVDNKNSEFAQFVRKKMRNAAESDKIDRHYQLSALKEVSAPLDDLVRVGSIDNSAGESLINVIFLFPKFGSLESLWTVEEHYSYYKRRLDKFFRIVGDLPQVYISGHSRGGAIALDFLARNAKDPEAQGWTKNIKGFVGFNGALMGIHFADAWFDETKRSNILRKETLQFKTLEEKNEIFASIINREKIVTSLGAVGKELAFGGSNPFEPTAFNRPDLTAGIHFIRQIEEQLQPESVFGDYRSYIKRLKRGAEAIDECLRSLTHKVRIDWWKKNTLPPHLKYYTFVATMHSPLGKDGLSWAQKSLKNSPYYQNQSLDYTIWRKIYTEHHASGAVALLDGPVAAHEGSIWPEWHRQENPQQAPYRSTILGIFGTHHMGLTYALGAGDDQDGVNPFPRRALLITLARYLGSRD